MKRLSLLCSLALAILGCGWIPGQGIATEGGPSSLDPEDLPPASKFECEDADDALLCADFNDGEADGFRWEGGEWEVIDGRLVGFGPDAPPGSCTDSLMTHAVLTDVAAQDVHVSLEMAALERVDKVLLLRSVDSANRLQLNFRALTDDGDYGDLIVQETRDCVFTVLTEIGEVPIGHDMGEKIDVEVDLVGTHLTVKVNGFVVLERDFPIAVHVGSVGLGVIDHATSVFDDIVISAPE